LTTPVIDLADHIVVRPSQSCTPDLTTIHT